MPRLLRIVFTWLLALALPLQGQAAAAMLNCGPVKAAVQAGAGPDHAPDHGAHHDHAAHAPQGHAASHNPAASADHPGCSACAACCVGMALPSRAPRVAAPPPAAAEYPAPLAGHDSVVTGGLERPPRTVLA